MKRNFRKPYRIKKKKSILKSRFFWLPVLIFTTVGGICYFIFFSSFFQIKEVKISGNQKIATNKLESLVQSQLTKKIALFPTKSIFLANLGKIQKMGQDNFPQIAKISFKKDFPDIILVNVEERNPVAVLTHTLNSSSTALFATTSAEVLEENFFIDKEGIVFEKVLDPDSNLLKIENQILPNKLRLGESVIEEPLVAKILNIESKLKNELEIKIDTVTIVSRKRLNVKAAEGWEVYFNPEGDMDWQITELTAVLENKIPPEKRKNLGYIDLRFEKIYIFPENYNK
ncbi:MAG: cell division protein FtsQ/DivIB [Candidatus Pacebacteria bacterium]|nr:cell division protein FtsQ/DivIB [Candidatus Paceibacterota bacterium]